MNNRKLKLEVVTPTTIKCGHIYWFALDTKLVGKTKALIEENERLNKELDYISSELNKCQEKILDKDNIINELEKCLEEEQDRLVRECSNIYEDSLGKTKLVNEDIFDEIIRIKDKLKELKERKD